MYDVLDVSRYIINYCNEKGYPISNLKLQKLLYFVQAYFLVKKNEACFEEPIEAWQYGPVVPKAYHEFKEYGSNSIPFISDIVVPINDSDPVNIWNMQAVPYQTNINFADASMVKKVVNDLAKYSAADLVEATHLQKPWFETYSSKNLHNEISIESIKNYFTKK